MIQPCPLCLNESTVDFFSDQRRKYRRCDRCALVFVPTAYHISAEAERAEYDLHQNSAEDPGYRKFLSRVFKPVSKQIEPRSRGLDFGCGPGPTLSVMFSEAGHAMKIYDPFYAPDESVLNVEYDFVTATEVVEHFRNPAADWRRLFECVRPDGRLGIMTKMVIDQASFSNWHYKNDLTHVSFYSRATFRWLAKKRNAGIEFHGADVVLFANKA